jgi:hypothetical protein
MNLMSLRHSQRRLFCDNDFRKSMRKQAIEKDMTVIQYTRECVREMKRINHIPILDLLRGHDEKK